MTPEEAKKILDKGSMKQKTLLYFEHLAQFNFFGAHKFNQELQDRITAVYTRVSHREDVKERAVFLKALSLLKDRLLQLKSELWYIERDTYAGLLEMKLHREYLQDYTQHTEYYDEPNIKERLAVQNELAALAAQLLRLFKDTANELLPIQSLKEFIDIEQDEINRALSLTSDNVQKILEIKKTLHLYRKHNVLPVKLSITETPIQKIPNEAPSADLLNEALNDTKPTASYIELIKLLGR